MEVRIAEGLKIWSFGGDVVKWASDFKLNTSKECCNVTRVPPTMMGRVCATRGCSVATVTSADLSLVRTESYFNIN